PNPFLNTSTSNSTLTNAHRLKTARDLVATLRRFGFVNITGHGLTKDETADMFSWSRKLFDLPVEEKMKAPHPDGPMPHRGYSGIGKEKVYARGEKGEGAREMKESYEIGSQHDDQQQNIWLPNDVLPGFQPYMSSLYERLAAIGDIILDAIGVGLSLDSEEHAALMQMASKQHSQLRLLHYPAISREEMQRGGILRLTPHTDWGTFTFLFQDHSNDLELQDPETKQLLRVSPPEDALTLNVSDMLQRFTNGYFTSALHRVSLPSADNAVNSGVPPRYSIPFFIAPRPSHLVQVLPRFVSADKPVKYEPVKFEDYGALAAKYMYREE
ncbi:hypothetical protein B0T16DRAFT_499786, partial [Cercophora newfieldiana]